MSIHITNPIVINLYDDNANNVDPNDSNDMYEVIEINHELSSQLSKALTRAPNDKQIYSSLEHGTCLKLTIDPSTMLTVTTIASYLPPLTDIKKDWG